ncbi:MAG: YggT family protein [Clostridiales bacterium]|nr:YggT family protein [Clostridiales bacterium]
MAYVLSHSLYLFFMMLEMILFLYLVLSWFPNASRMRGVMLTLLDPIFTPIRFLLKHSILYNSSFDLTPMITLIVLSYLQSLFYNLV